MLDHNRWSLTPDGPVVYKDEQEIHNLSVVDGDVIHLYAVWDDYPRFDIDIIGVYVDFPDRWFSLDDAQSGRITREELLSCMSATDREDNDLTITIIDYDPAFYTDLIHPAETTQTFRVEDSYGHVSYITVTIHVLDDNEDARDEIVKLRAFDADYYMRNGSYVSVEDGGLPENCQWRTDPALEQLLRDVVVDGGRNIQTYTYSFDSDSLKKLREYAIESSMDDSTLKNGGLSQICSDYIRQHKRQN